MIVITDSGAVVVHRPTSDSLGKWEIDTTLTNSDDIEDCRRAVLDGEPRLFRFFDSSHVQYEGSAHVTYIKMSGKMMAQGTNAPRRI